MFLLPVRDPPADVRLSVVDAGAMNPCGVFRRLVRGAVKALAASGTGKAAAAG